MARSRWNLASKPDWEKISKQRARILKGPRTICAGKEGAWMGRLSVPLREALILAELSWQKAKDLPSYAWGGLVVSFATPVERCLKDHYGLFGTETLGEVIPLVRNDPEWPVEMSKCLDKLNRLFVRAKHLGLRPIAKNEVPVAKRLAFKISSVAARRNR